MRAVSFIEDRTYAAKRRIELIIKIISGLHSLLLLRNVSKLLILYSLIIQFVFFSLLEDYPAFLPTSPYFLGGTFGALINHFLFLRELVVDHINVLEAFVYFFLFVWATPFCFFLSLSANDESFAVKNRKRETFIGKLIKKIYAPHVKHNTK
ncbi:transmembrane adaptor Erv26 [Tubulinosema ratisbonensis]|uniref:Transmembrane adaptor Erv26 n=1 Tax=Tubulinosema ratisbonensis TaxID=291195 RepID=A0A437AMJ5_9MICR|nr:transmembrane adaptor Erv26 [Tubulinosema ratisbonensis]